MAQPLPEEETTASPASGPAARPRRTARLRAVRPDESQKQAATDAGPDPLSLAKDIVTFASDKGAADVLLMDVRKQTIIADYFVICSGDNERQIRAINRGIQDGVAERYGLDPAHRSDQTQEQAGWVVLDYGSVVIHVFSPQMREFYRLERLWNEAATLLRMQ
jgi:ribosome-associated protein